MGDVTHFIREVARHSAELEAVNGLANLVLDAMTNTIPRHVQLDVDVQPLIAGCAKAAVIGFNEEDHWHFRHGNQ